VLIALLLFFFDFPACVRSRKRSYAFRSAAEDAFLPPGLAAVWPTAERRKELAPGSLVEAGSRTSFIRLRSYQPEMFRRKKRNDPKSGLASPNHTTTLTAPVLGCIEIKFCNQRFFVQHVSQDIRDLHTVAPLGIPTFASLQTQKNVKILQCFANFNEFPEFDQR